MRKRNLIVMTLVGTMAIAITGCSNHTDAKKEADTQTVASETADEPSETEENNDIKTESQTPQSETESPASEVETTTEKEETQMDEQEVTTVVQQAPPKPSEQETTHPAEVQTTQPATEQPTVEKAGAEDCEAIADKIIEYINSYRETPATKLPGLTVYAQYRSRQLVSNFAHDNTDERAAATTLEYGNYIDSSVYGIEGEPYYVSGAREAIAAGGYVGDIDYVAQQIALLVKGSQNHWCYVGNSEYPYIAVGVTYESGMWYCDIAMAMENTDE